MTPHVLIVDDEPDLHLLFKLKFRPQIEGGEITFYFASDGVEALRVLDEQPDIDFVVTDLNMPHMDGLTLLSELDKRQPPVTAVILTAYGDMDNIRVAMQHGAFDFLTKPIDFDDVTHTFEKAMRHVVRLRDSRRAEEFRIARDAAEEHLQRLTELESLKDQLIHLIVHDLRTPLSSLIIGAQTLGRMGDLNEIQRECLSMTIEGGHKLLCMINDMLDVSKMEARELRLNYTKLDVVELARKSVASMTALAQVKELNLRLDVPETCLICADLEKLQRVLNNLLGNAVKFTPVDGEITLRVETCEAKEEILVSVTDNGPGIPVQYQQCIFEKFGQIEPSSAGYQASSGLGLFFCKMMVEEHGGRIWVESTPGQGSVFCFTLPLSPAAR